MPITNGLLGCGNSGKEVGAVAIKVTSPNDTVKQIEPSAYDPISRAINVKLQAVGGSGGVYTSDTLVVDNDESTINAVFNPAEFVQDETTKEISLKQPPPTSTKIVAYDAGSIRGISITSTKVSYTSSNGVNIFLSGCNFGETSDFMLPLSLGAKYKIGDTIRIKVLFNIASNTDNDIPISLTFGTIYSINDIGVLDSISNGAIKDFTVGKRTFKSYTLLDREIILYQPADMLVISVSGFTGAGATSDGKLAAVGKINIEWSAS